jgi:hypothetical protein
MVAGVEVSSQLQKARIRFRDVIHREKSPAGFRARPRGAGRKFRAPASVPNGSRGSQARRDPGRWRLGPPLSDEAHIVAADLRPGTAGTRWSAGMSHRQAHSFPIHNARSTCPKRRFRPVGSASESPLASPKRSFGTGQEPPRPPGVTGGLGTVLSRGFGQVLDDVVVPVPGPALGRRSPRQFLAAARNFLFVCRRLGRTDPEPEVLTPVSS